MKITFKYWSASMHFCVFLSDIGVDSALLLDTIPLFPLVLCSDCDIQ